MVLLTGPNITSNLDISLLTTPLGNAYKPVDHVTLIGAQAQNTTLNFLYIDINNCLFARQQLLANKNYHFNGCWLIYS